MSIKERKLEFDIWFWRELTSQIAKEFKLLGFFFFFGLFLLSIFWKFYWSFLVELELSLLLMILINEKHFMCNHLTYILYYIMHSTTIVVLRLWFIFRFGLNLLSFHHVLSKSECLALIRLVCSGPRICWCVSR